MTFFFEVMNSYKYYRMSREQTLQGVQLIKNYTGSPLLKFQRYFSYLAKTLHLTIESLVKQTHGFESY